ncbi:MAG: sensor histidine kinase [Treponema sp.]|jgi:two-component system sensor histidine kinase HydH|nr:sensor histidine kinase [Treponema sp.]
MKKSLRTSSFAAAVFGWALLSALTVFILWGMRDRARLIRDNDNERIFNMLFAGLRNYDDFGSAVESNSVLAGRIAGVAVYGADLSPAYRWGKVPELFDERLLDDADKSRFGRFTIPDKQGRSVKFVLHTDRMGPAGQPRSPEGENRRPGRPDQDRANPDRMDQGRMDQGRVDQGRQGFLFFNTLSRGKYFYIDISHPAYWRTQALTTALLPLCALILLFLVFYIRHLYLRNLEYRERIEAQQNLVVLGTAASTLAHEIKNPLLSIRLQTGILEKSLFPEKTSANEKKAVNQNGAEEIAIINQEVDRLSALVYRVNDYLREAAGHPVPVNCYELLAGTSRRLCDKNIIQDDSEHNSTIFADTERIRSVLENILRNALESGGRPEETGASIKKADGLVIISIYDRGSGIPEENMKRIFDPFFTSKSTGTGIGLSISKRFVEAAGGTIAAANREGGGIMVTVTFPEYNK